MKPNYKTAIQRINMLISYYELTDNFFVLYNLKEIKKELTIKNN